jgi:hypothetical protein
MPKFKVSYTVTKYVDRYIEADSDEAGKALFYDEEIETGYDEGDFESDEVEEIGLLLHTDLDIGCAVVAK